MNNQNERNRTDEQAGNDKNIDTTRSQNREAVADAGNGNDSTRMGAKAEAGNAHSKKGHTGSHQEGEYDKDHLEKQPEEGSQEHHQKK